MQGWQEIDPIIDSPFFGHLFKNIVVGEVARFFVNRGMQPSLYFVRSKERVDVDLSVELGDRRYLALEVKSTPEPWTQKQRELVDSLGLAIVDRWVVSASPAISFKDEPVIAITKLWDRLAAIV